MKIPHFGIRFRQDPNNQWPSRQIIQSRIKWLKNRPSIKDISNNVTIVFKHQGFQVHYWAEGPEKRQTKPDKMDLTYLEDGRVLGCLIYDILDMSDAVLKKPTR